MLSAVTILNIPVTHLWKLWMENMRVIGSWSRDPGLLSDDTNKIYKGIEVNTDNN